MKQDKRFRKIYSQSMGTMEIWVDRETGVNYLYHNGGYGGGLTPLWAKTECPSSPPYPKLRTDL